MLTSEIKSLSVLLWKGGMDSTMASTRPSLWFWVHAIYYPAAYCLLSYLFGFS